MGKLTNKARLKRLHFLLYREWELLRLNLEYREDYKEFTVQKKKWESKDYSQTDPVSFLLAFRKKYHIFPINPNRSFDDILTEWVKSLPPPGYKRPPFPLELLYRKGISGLPIFIHKGLFSRDTVRVIVNRECSISEILFAINSYLDDKGMVRNKTLNLTPVTVQELSNGDLDIIISLNSEKGIIKTEVKRYLKAKGFANSTRKDEVKAFDRKLKVYHYVTNLNSGFKRKQGGSKEKSFDQISLELKNLYPNMTKEQRTKACSDDFNDMLRETKNQGKGRNEIALSFVDIENICDDCGKKGKCKGECDLLPKYLDLQKPKGQPYIFSLTDLDNLSENEADEDNLSYIELMAPLPKRNRPLRFD